MIGRKREMEKLIDAYNSDDAEFVGVYGRRRVGKTYLVGQTFAGKFVFQHSGLSPLDEERESDEIDTHEESAMEKQLRHFHTSLLREGEKERKPPKSWEEAFYRLDRLIAKKKALKGKKKVVFIDELPWMDTPRSGFMSALEGFWNTWGCFQDDLLLIVAGSATSWMTNKLINNHGGLYGRLTREIRLSPLSLGECKEFFASKGISISDYDTAQAYMIFGGIPFYLQDMKRGQSLPQYIDECFFAKNARFRREYTRLFGSVFSNPDTMKAIVRALSQKRMGMTREEIEKTTGIKAGGTLTKQLDSLVDSDFVIEYYPFGMGKRESYYRLSDPFCWFFLRFVDGQESLSTDFWKENLENQSVVTWRGLAFENLCFLHVKQIKTALGVASIRSEESSYIAMDPNGKPLGQIDLIISRADNIVDICEAKFYSDSVLVDSAMERKAVRNAILVQKLIPKKAITHKVLLTTFGVSEGEYMWTFDNVITLEDLMRI